MSMLNAVGMFSAGAGGGFGLQFNGSNQTASASTISYANQFNLEFDFERASGSVHVLGRSFPEQTVLIIGSSNMQYYSDSLNLLTGSFSFAVNQRYSIKMTKDATDLVRMYVNGNQIASGVVSGGLVFNQLFKFGGSGPFGAGKIWNLKIGTNAATPATDRVYLNETGTGSTWFDVGNNVTKRDFTTVNSPVWIPN